MKYTIARSIAILFFVLGIKTLTEGIDINNYFRLIYDVHKYYHTLCVIFVWSGNYGKYREQFPPIIFAFHIAFLSQLAKRKFPRTFKQILYHNFTCK